MLLVDYNPHDGTLLNVSFSHKTGRFTRIPHEMVRVNSQKLRQTIPEKRMYKFFIDRVPRTYSLNTYLECAILDDPNSGVEVVDLGDLRNRID
jgi:hypothetical protein